MCLSAGAWGAPSADSKTELCLTAAVDLGPGKTIGIRVREENDKLILTANEVSIWHSVIFDFEPKPLVEIEVEQARACGIDFYNGADLTLSLFQIAGPGTAQYLRVGDLRGFLNGVAIDAKVYTAKSQPGPNGYCD